MIKTRALAAELLHHRESVPASPAFERTVVAGAAGLPAVDSAPKLHPWYRARSAVAHGVWALAGRLCALWNWRRHRYVLAPPLRHRGQPPGAHQSTAFALDAGAGADRDGAAAGRLATFGNARPVDGDHFRHPVALDVHVFRSIQPATDRKSVV